MEKKASDVRILWMTPLTVMTDYFVICSGSTLIQARAIADAVEEALEQRGVVPRHREHSPGSGWILLDYGSVVVHVFREEERQFYSLERLWGDAREVAFAPSDDGGVVPGNAGAVSSREAAVPDGQAAAPDNAPAVARTVKGGEFNGHAGYRKES